MAVAGIGGSAALTLATIGELRTQLDDLQRQLGTGKKSTTYAGLGTDRGLTVGLRTQLSAISGYQQSITQVGVRLDLMQTALTQFSSASQQFKSTIIQSQFVLGGSTQTQDQVNARGVLDQLVGMLNTGADGRYVFSGSSVDQVPVETADHILNGDGLKAGLKQLIEERRQADLGTSGLGRLTVSSPSGTSVSLTEDAGVFGFKLVGAVTSTPTATVTGPSGAPPELNVDFGGTNPSPGDTIRISFALPDGSTQDLTLTATASSPPGPGEFEIGANSAATAANLQSALTSSLSTLAQTALVAASATAAGDDFFNTDAANPPQRVDGPPFDTAIGLIDGTDANTVSWYVGDNGTGDPRQTAVARVDGALTVAYGARASEDALRIAVQSIAVFAAVEFSTSDPNAEAQYTALKQRASAALVGSANEQKVSDIAGQLAGVQVALTATKDRHDQTSTTLQNLLTSVEGAPTEVVAAQILAVQTNLQATLQTTAMLLRTSLINYL